MTALEARVRERLRERRRELVDLAATSRERRLVDLVRRVDDALAAIEVGTWGVCAVCHEAIASSRLEADPLVTVCLECLSEEARRALERDLEAAARVQRALMPPTHLIHAGWEVAYLWEPLAAVSGDHVDLVRSPAGDDGLLLIVGDVAGKGVAASLLQSHLHALLRALAPAERSVDALLTRANQQFAAATLSASYATLAAFALRPDGRAELANAGHPRPLLADARGVRPVEGTGLPLGLFGGSTYAQHELALAPGQTLLVYTDGWTEAERDGDEYGIGRAAAALRKTADRPLPDLLAACRADFETHLAGAPRGDDLTLVAVRRTANQDL